MKASRNDPQAWAEFLDNHKLGDELEGTVTSVAAFGAFVEISDGVDGLVHISEMEGQLGVGDRVRVRILDIDKESRRISLAPCVTA